MRFPLRASPLALAVLLLASMPAVASHAWAGEGIGDARMPGLPWCASAFTVALQPAGGTWDATLVVAPVEPRLALFCAPRIFAFSGVQGSASTGWSFVAQGLCQHASLGIGPVGSAPAGLTTIRYAVGDSCTGAIDTGNGSLAVAGAPV